MSIKQFSQCIHIILSIVFPILVASFSQKYCHQGYAALKHILYRDLWRIFWISTLCPLSSERLRFSISCQWCLCTSSQITESIASIEWYGVVRDIRIDDDDKAMMEDFQLKCSLSNSKALLQTGLDSSPFTPHCIVLREQHPSSLRCLKVS